MLISRFSLQFYGLNSSLRHIGCEVLSSQCVGSVSKEKDEIINNVSEI